MHIALDQLESLWPPYRGAVLLGAAQKSHGCISYTHVSVTAGHIALTLTTAGSKEATAAAAAAAADRDDGTTTPASCLTVLLDAVPATAPTPSTQQMAAFLTKVLALAAPQDTDNAGNGFADQEEGSLGDDIPEMLVVQHNDEVVCSEFVRFDHRRAESETSTGGGVTWTRSNQRRGSGLVYACIEGSGLMRLWEWGGTANGPWSWSYLNSCNVCACREDPIGCRVLTAAIVPEPGDCNGKCDNRMSRLVWEQEDSGEGAGLGLASAPSPGPCLPRRMWSRRLTFDLVEGGISNDGLGIPHQQQQQQQQQSMEGGNGAGFGRSDAGDRIGSARSEISLTFSACLLPTGVDALLCSRRGAWMPTGSRVYFNHFATGRLPCVVLPSVIHPGGGRRRIGVGAASPESGIRRHGREAGTDESSAFKDAESAPEVGQSWLEQDSGDGEHDGVKAAAEMKVNKTSSASARRLFAVHESTEDLMFYDHYPCATVCVVSLPRGEGGLKLRLQCTLDPPPPPSSPPHSFAARSNLAVLCGGGVCWVYDLCTGRLLGKADIPRCSSIRFRQRHRSKTSASISISQGHSSAGGRRRGLTSSELFGGRLGASANPTLWASETRGHLAGILTATQVLRIKLPRVEACLRATFGCPSHKGNSSPPSAPSILRSLREYRRLVHGTGGGACPASLLPELLQMVQKDRISYTPATSDATKRVAVMDLIAHTLAAEERGFSQTAAATGDPNDGRNGQEARIPPWLLMAMVSASRNQEREQGSWGQVEAGGNEEPPKSGGGDPASAATEAGLRIALERRVSESLRSLSSVRALLQDPAGSARRRMADGGGGGLRSAADDEAAGKLAELTSAVDPATALFEGTLRQWLASRRKAKGERAWHSYRGGPGEDLASRPWGPSGLGLDWAAGESRTGSHDALALAFRCEAAGDEEAMEVSFLQFLLEGSRGAGDPGQTPDRAGGAGDIDGEGKSSDKGTPFAASSSSSFSTFLCLHLASDDTSRLFEIGCRALFRLQPLRLPRFVERLARFRAYADGIKEDGVRAGDTPQERSNDHEGEGKEGDPPLLLLRRERQRSSSAGARSEETLGGDSGGGGSGGRADSSAASAGEEQQQHRSTSPLSQVGTPSRLHGEDNAPDTGGRISRPQTLASSTGTTREHSSERTAPAPAPALASNEPSFSSAADASLHAGTASPNNDAAPHDPRQDKRSQKALPIAPAYFARALACLPPAAGDDQGDASGSQQRRARLSLLLGARMFTEACRLLRRRAWEGSDGQRSSWRRDSGAAKAWSATVRLLNELSRAAAREKGEDTTVAAAAVTSGDATSSTPAAASTGAEVATDAGAGNGGNLSLQFRLSFEDALAETILADSPERMKEVMLCQPSGLTPVAVVRMVRRAAEATAAGLGDGDSKGGQLLISGSTQTLKMCLLLLLEDGERPDSGAV